MVYSGFEKRNFFFGEKKNAYVRGRRNVSADTLNYE